MQTVDVLRDQAQVVADALLEPRERLMSEVGLRGGEHLAQV
jgi:hypothetical protein